MKKWKQKMIFFMRKSKSYFKDCEKEIALKNFKMLRSANILQLFLVVVYFIVSAFTFRSKVIDLLYLAYVVCNIIFVLYTSHYLTNKATNFKTIQRACWIFDALCIGFIILISVYPLVDNPAIFFLIMIVFIPILFTLPFIKMVCFVSGAEVVFLILAGLIKTDNAFKFDLFSSITAWIFAVVATYLVTDLRVYQNQMNREISVERSTKRNQNKDALQRKPVMLIAEDLEVAREALSSIFEKEFTILQAENGAQVMQKLGKYKNVISIVMLDLRMPVMDGYEVLRRMRVHAVYQKIPVVVISSEAESELFALELGAVDMIVKPFEPLIVKKRVENVLQRNRE